MSEQHPQITWGRLKAWAADNKVPDDAVVAYKPGRPHTGHPEMAVRDIDQFKAEDGWEPEGDDPGQPDTPAMLLLREHYDG